MSAQMGTPRVRLCLGVTVSVLGCYGIAVVATQLVGGRDDLGRSASTALLAACLATVAAWFVLPRLAATEQPIPPEDPPLPEAERLARRLDFDRQLDRALERAHNERDLFELASRALGAMWPEARAEVLMVSGPDRHGRSAPLAQVAETGPDGEGPGCAVSTAAQCEAIRRDRTLRWSSSEDIDACPLLAHREGQACSAVCVPIRIVGSPAGVLHRTAPTTHPAQDFDVAALESLAARIEARLSMAQLVPNEVDLADANGVFGRAALDGRISGLLRSLTPFALARCDVEDIAHYRDRHGEQAMAQALRCFERVTVRYLRPDDTVGRVGPHELVAVLPGASIGDARRVLERIREELTLQLNQLQLAPLRLATGTVQSHGRHDLDELLDAVDAAVISPSRPGGDS